MAIRDAKKLSLVYCDEVGVRTERVVRPVALVYHLESVMVAAWCELRGGFRHFRTDRIYELDILVEDFAAQAEPLRALWAEANRWDSRGDDVADLETLAAPGAL